MSDESGVQILDAGVDWITVTETNGDATDDLLAVAYDIKQNHIPKDVIPSTWGMSGYSGQQYGQLKTGTRGDGEGILIMSGALAREAYPPLVMDWDRVTRIDLQVTVGLHHQDDRIARRYHRELQDLGDSKKSGKIWKYISSPSGDTLYFGKRTHNRYLRFYDKSCDYGMSEPGWAWRYEVEYKKNEARRIAKTVSYMKDPYVEISSLVWQAFKSVNFEPMYNSKNRVSVMDVGLSYKTPTSQLKWLEKCVSPVVMQLMTLGYEQAVIDSLGLKSTIRKVKKDGVK